MSSKRELREAIRQWAEITFAISRQRDEARAERDDIRDQLAQAIAEREEMAQEVIAAHRERDNLRADLAQARLDLLDPTPEPRPFRVGDRVRVAEGATFRYGGERKRSLSTAGGCDGTVVDTYCDGDIGIRRDGVTHVSVASPEFCTLIEDEPEVVLPLPEGYTFTAPESNVPAPPEPTRTGVTLHTHDGRELWIPCEDPDLEEGVNGLWVVPEGRLTHSVAYVNTVAIVAAVVTK